MEESYPLCGVAGSRYGNQLTTDTHWFTYQSGDGSTQTETEEPGDDGGYDYDSISIQKPTEWRECKL